jgi:hypothetical protein
MARDWLVAKIEQHGWVYFCQAIEDFVPVGTIFRRHGRRNDQIFVPMVDRDDFWERFAEAAMDFEEAYEDGPPRSGPVGDDHAV